MSHREEIDNIQMALDYIKPHRQQAREYGMKIYDALLTASVILDDRKNELEKELESAEPEVRT